MEEKQGHWIWLIPLFIIPLIMWGVFSIADGLGTNVKRLAQEQENGVIPGIGGGPGNSRYLDVGSTAQIEDLQVD